ncbi:MAG: PilT/PilU family type 4a pilus ATPase [Clostridiales bacterium]|jgi:twitching motility protein PilT|nr:PilT/PilU family type 4a pilus ATPase [Clostridiales bacterium]
MAAMIEWLKKAVDTGASDIFIGAGRCVSFKIEGVITKQSETTVKPDEADAMVTELYELARRPINKFLETGDDDFPVSVPGLARFRISAYWQRGTKAAVVRVVLFQLPDYKELHITEDVMSIASERHGLALVTGPAGSGKTTTLACIIDAINKTRNSHVITLEDPIEYLHRDMKSLISQREVSTDTGSYLTALRACMRQAPDIILLGEMRDHETIRTAMTAAETGHLVISTLHTLGVVNTVDRIIDVFPPDQQQQIRVQLSMVLQTVVSQQLLPNKSGNLIPAFEIMRPNNAIRNLIRESKIHQIDGVIQTSRSEGMISMDTSILNLYQQGEITTDTAISHSVNASQLAKRLGI